MEPEEARSHAAPFTCRVVEGHQASFPEALVFAAGDELAVEERRTAWEGWIWCVDRDGRGAWVPEDFVHRRGDRCVALRDYDSDELTIRVGDILIAWEEARGWLWCAASSGARGWVPAACVEPL